jgi:hypothetical protein
LRYDFKCLDEIQVTITPIPSGRPDSNESVSEYDLKIDTQVEKFLETKHKLVYFLVTASVAPIIAVVQFVYGKPILMWAKAAAGVGIVGGLLAAGSALAALWYEVASYRNHIQYRYARKKWDDLTVDQQKAWTTLNRKAVRFIRIAFLLLYVEFILFAIVGISILFLPQVRSPATLGIQLSFP